MFDDFQHLLNSLARGLGYFYNVELLYPLDEFQTNFIFYKGNIRKKSLLMCGRHNKSNVFVLCFSIKDQICLKLVKCFCCYYASTKTSFGFCSCSELLQLKFGEINVAGKCKLLRRYSTFNISSVQFFS